MTEPEVKETRSVKKRLHEDAMTAIFESKQGEEAFIVPPTYDSL
jgi:hypothetical protein